MKNHTLSLLAAAAVIALPLGAEAGERAKADVDCTASEETLVYDCTIMLMGKKSGVPMDGAKIVVGADMAAMPMAHNVKPVTAMPTGKPGMYHARIHLQMHGDWTLKLDVSGPARDRIVVNRHFAPGAGGKPTMQHGQEQMKHK